MHAGCSDSAEDVLPVGTGVVLSAGTAGTVRVWVARPGGRAEAAHDRAEVPDGAHAVVVADAPVAPPKQPALRLTRVRLVDAPLVGTVVEVGRYKLRARR